MKIGISVSVLFNPNQIPDIRNTPTREKAENELNIVKCKVNQEIFENHDSFFNASSSIMVSEKFVSIIFETFAS